FLATPGGAKVSVGAGATAVWIWSRRVEVRICARDAEAGACACARSAEACACARSAEAGVCGRAAIVGVCAGAAEAGARAGSAEARARAGSAEAGARAGSAAVLAFDCGPRDPGTIGAAQPGSPACATAGCAATDRIRTSESAAETYRSFEEHRDQDWVAGVRDGRGHHRRRNRCRAIRPFRG